MKMMHEEEEHEKENSERWLLTYSDMITLLLALFIILYAMSNIDLEKFKELAAAFGDTFNPSSSSATGGGGSGDGINSGLTIGAGDGDGESSKSGDDDGFVGEVNPNDALRVIYEEIRDFIEANDLVDKIDLDATDTSVNIRLRDTLLFYPDTPRMLDESRPILSEIEQALAHIYDSIDHITISGHVADPYNAHGEYSSSFAWDLSIDRANAVRRFMSDNGLKEDKLSVEGYSHNKPIGDNTSEEGMAKNRRVEITIWKYNPSSN